MWDSLAEADKAGEFVPRYVTRGAASPVHLPHVPREEGARGDRRPRALRRVLSGRYWVRTTPGADRHMHPGLPTVTHDCPPRTSAPPLTWGNVVPWGDTRGSVDGTGMERQPTRSVPSRGRNGTWMERAHDDQEGQPRAWQDDQGTRGFGAIEKLPSGRFPRLLPGAGQDPTQRTQHLRCQGGRGGVAEPGATPHRLGCLGDPRRTPALEASKNVTFAAYAETFLAERPLKPTTHMHYRALVRNQLNSHVWRRRPCEPSRPTRCRAWHNEMGTRPRPCEPTPTACCGPSWDRPSTTA